MMQFLRILCGMLFAALMTACGGGGGSPGATPGGGSTPGGGVTPAKPTIALDIVTASGVVTTSVSNSTVTFARATVTDAGGAKAAGTVVTFSTASALVVFSPSSGTALTDANGVATVQILPASSGAGGAGVLNADATVGTTAATQAQYSFQVAQGTPDTPTARVANFALLLDKSTLPNGGTATAKLTVVAVDATNNVVPGAAVSVATDANSIFIPGGSVTDGQGQYTGQISVGTDKSDRQITASVTVNGMTKTTSVKVIGSKITLQATPSAPAPGQAVALTATLVDSGGNPIGGVPITFAGTVPALQNATATTDGAGVASKAFLAPTVAGVYTISASGNGIISTDYQLQVFSSVVPAAIIPVGATPSLAPNPTVLAINSPGSTASRASLRFLFLDSSNNPVQNVRVRFVDTTTGLPAVGASISSGTNLLYTDASGSATTQYIAGQNSSPTNGVSIKACYSANDFPVSECPASISASLTVAGQALAVSIGDDNLLQKGQGTYIKRFAVTVADSAGRAVPNAPVDISVDLTHFGKGSFDYGYVKNDESIEFLAAVPLGYLDAFPSATTVPSELAGRVWCANEDHNRNGSVDPLENLNGSTDSNGQATLEPRKADLIVSYDDPSVTSTNASGILVIKVEYSQRFATWLAYKVRVTASVAGSQGMAERLFVTSFVQGDLSTGSFLEPPYGFNSCSSPL